MSAAKHEAIANAFKAEIEAITLGTVKTVVRAEIDRLTDESLPMAIVTMGEERDEQYLTGDNVLRMYEIVVTYLVAGNLQLETEIATAKGLRERTRKRVTNCATVPVPTPLAALGVYDVKTADLPAQNSGQFHSGYQTARFGAVVRTSESIP